jgi:hypothetical protein
VKASEVAVADIDVVRKRGIPMWVWLAIAVLALIILFALMRRGGDTTQVPTRSDRAAPAAVAAAPLRA